MKNWYLVVDVTEKGKTIVNEDEFKESAIEKANGHFHNAQLPAHIGDVPEQTVVVEVSWNEYNNLRDSLSRENLKALGIQKKTAYRKQKLSEFVENNSIVHIEK